MDLAENIAIDRRGLLINGKRLPFYIADRSIHVEVEDSAVSYVTVTLLADSVSIGAGVEVDDEGNVVLVDEPPFESA